MMTERLIHKINHLVHKNDYRSARTTIESNMDVLQRDNNYLRLSYEAHQLFNIIKAEKEKGSRLTRFEIHMVREINKASNNFDITMLRMLLKTGKDVLSKKEVQMLLTPTAKSVLESVGYLVDT